MIDQTSFRVGDTIGHPSWGDTSYTCTRITNDRFWIDLMGDETGFPYYIEFFVVKKIPKKKSGFSSFIRKIENG